MRRRVFLTSLIRQQHHLFSVAVCLRDSGCRSPSLREADTYSPAAAGQVADGDRQEILDIPRLAVFSGMESNFQSTGPEARR